MTADPHAGLSGPQDALMSESVDSGDPLGYLALATDWSVTDRLVVADALGLRAALLTVIARTLTLSPYAVGQLHDDMTVGVIDSAGEVVAVSMHDRPGDGGLRLTLDEEHLWAATAPTGAVCVDDGRSVCWVVHVEDACRVVSDSDIAASETRRG